MTTRNLHSIRNIVQRLSTAVLAALCLAGTLSAQLVPNLGGQRSGISSYQFLKIGADARGAAMSEAIIAVTNDIGSIYWNPAGLANSTGNQIMVSHAEWLVDVQHEFGAASYRLDDNNAVGLSFVSLHTDPMKITTEYLPEGNGNYFNFSDVAVGATFSRKMTDQFSFGVTAKYVREAIAELHTDAFLVDLGTFYYMGIGSSRFSVVVSNFGGNVKPKGSVTNGKGKTSTEFQEFSPPTMFRLGFAFEPYQDEENRLTASIQLNHPNDNAENIRLGAEYAYGNIVFLRGGVKRTIGEPLLARSTSSAEDLSFGGGVRLPVGFGEANIDYAFTNFNELGSVHRITVALTY